MEPLVQFTLAVLTLFAFNALLALGMGLIFGQLKVVNVAHGDMATVGAYVMFLAGDIPFFPRLILACTVGVLIGYLSERFLLRRLYERGALATLLAMWGIAILIRQGADALFGSTPASVAAPTRETVAILGTQYPLYRLAAAAIALAVVAVCILVVYKTDLGLRLRASIENRTMASLVGISPSHMITGTFIIGITLAVLAGALQSPTLGVTPTVGVSLLAPAFFAVLISRPGSFTGPVFGALIVAVLTTTLRSLFDGVIADVIFYMLLIALIAFRPQGLNWRIPTPWKTKRSEAVF
jgi:branched-subunit amino acid ABC-type transport system permease component